MEPTRHQIETLIRVAAGAVGLDPDLCVRQCAAGSSFRVDAVSRCGCIGLFQLRPAIATELNVDPHRWQSNVWGGLHYMAFLLRHYDGNAMKAYAAYDHGLSNVDRLVADHGDAWHEYLPAETRAYLKKILGIKA